MTGKFLTLLFLSPTILFAQSQKKLTPTVVERSGTPVLNHIALYVINLQVSTAFYHDIIGLDTMPEPFHDGRHTWFRIGEHSHLHLISGAVAGTEHNKNTHLCFSVTSISDFIARLEKGNVNYENWIGEPKSVTTRADGIRQIYFRDPDGYWIEINDDNP
jgi:lactoylglutathione lyase